MTILFLSQTQLAQVTIYLVNIVNIYGQYINNIKYTHCFCMFNVMLENDKHTNSIKIIKSAITKEQTNGIKSIQWLLKVNWLNYVHSLDQVLNIQHQITF